MLASTGVDRRGRLRRARLVRIGLGVVVGVLSRPALSSVCLTTARLHDDLDPPVARPARRPCRSTRPGRGRRARRERAAPRSTPSAMKYSRDRAARAPREVRGSTGTARSRSARCRCSRRSGPGWGPPSAPRATSVEQRRRRRAAGRPDRCRTAPCRSRRVTTSPRACSSVWISPPKPAGPRARPRSPSARPRAARLPCALSLDELLRRVRAAARAASR